MNEILYTIIASFLAKSFQYANSAQSKQTKSPWLAKMTAEKLMEKHTNRIADTQISVD